MRWLTIVSRYLVAEKHFETIDVFEQQASFGGAWNYSEDLDGVIDVPQTDPHQALERPIWPQSHPQDTVTNGNQGATQTLAKPTFISPMYQGLEANIPHVLMKHSDDCSLEENQLFPSREKTIQYLEHYAQEIKHLVYFQTQVTDVRKSSLEDLDIWQLEAKDLRTGQNFRQTYDAVVVANGHYTVPQIPDIKGIRDWDATFSGAISHSKFYRKPDSYADKKVVIIGNSASGVDIASHIATVCRNPIIASSRSNSPLAYDANYKDNVGEILEFLPPSQEHRAIRFAGGRIETDVDAVLFATGYLYSLPFLPTLGSSLISTGERVHNLYKHLFYIDDTTLAFIGLPSKIIPFRTVEGQAAVIARVWADRLSLPSVQEMKDWEDNVIAERGPGKAFHVLSFPKDFEYHNDMVNWAMQPQDPAHGKIPLRWTQQETWLRERFPAIKKAFIAKGEARHRVTQVKELGFDYDNWLLCQQTGRKEEAEQLC